MIRQDTKTVLFTFSAVALMSFSSTALYQQQLITQEHAAQKVTHERQRVLEEEEKRLAFLQTLEKAIALEKKEAYETVEQPVSRISRPAPVSQKPQTPVSGAKAPVQQKKAQPTVAPTTPQVSTKAKQLQAQLVAQKRAARLAAANKQAAMQRSARRSRAS